MLLPRLGYALMQAIAPRPLPAAAGVRGVRLNFQTLRERYAGDAGQWRAILADNPQRLYGFGR